MVLYTEKVMTEAIGNDVNYDDWWRLYFAGGSAVAASWFSFFFFSLSFLFSLLKNMRGSIPKRQPTVMPSTRPCGKRKCFIVHTNLSRVCFHLQSLTLVAPFLFRVEQVSDRGHGPQLFPLDVRHRQHFRFPTHQRSCCQERQQPLLKLSWWGPNCARYSHPRLSWWSCLRNRSPRTEASW